MILHNSRFSIIKSISYHGLIYIFCVSGRICNTIYALANVRILAYDLFLTFYSVCSNFIIGTSAFFQQKLYVEGVFVMGSVGKSYYDKAASAQLLVGSSFYSQNRLWFHLIFLKDAGFMSAIKLRFCGKKIKNQWKFSLQPSFQKRLKSYGGRSLNVEIASARARAVNFQLFVPQKKLDT